MEKQPDAESDQQPEEAPSEYAVDDDESTELREEARQSSGTPQDQESDSPSQATGNPENAG